MELLQITSKKLLEITAGIANCDAFTNYVATPRSPIDLLLRALSFHLSL